ncbi:MAG: AraC family transcriptional regulator [Acetatifactor sp.]|nr:AraC family transcriptional regulator [Acetatifactor sp.]
MAIPIPFGYNFKVNHKKKDNSYIMPNLDMYGDIYGIGYMLSGDRMIITPDRTVLVHPCTVQFMHKNLYHRTTYVSKGIYENIEIKFNESVAKLIISVIGEKQFNRLYDLISVTLTPEIDEEIRHLMFAMEREWKNDDSYSDTIMKTLVIQFFITILRGYCDVPDMDILLKKKQMPLIDALHYVRQHYAQNPSLTETAEAVHISASYLSRLFKQEFGTSYSQFLNDIKISYAMKLLVNTNLSVVEIANQCGYQNSNYFSSSFKKLIGVSPLQFRKQQKT